ncbi:Sperm motility kinase [Sciurus carolinensis]|uniref:non-specific serine/threonine protein kinase n=1 Tax=Sciurus carolinensis TaxID=30640 RepID=A0AA41MKH9_SCICA|nr:Sperm motility kinase [Sciurus carolinensis]
MRVWPGVLVSCSLEDAFTGHYEVLRHVGQDSFAKVILAQHILMGTEVALKVLWKVEGYLPFLTPEVDIMKGVEHPYVVQLLEIMDTPGNVYV